MIVYANGTVSPGLTMVNDVTPNRVYRQFASASSGLLEQIQTEEAALSPFPYRVSWITAAKEIQAYLGTTAFVSWAIATGSTKIWGGMQFARGLLLGNATKRRAVRGEDGVPGTGTNRTYEPGDFLIDFNTGRQIKVKAKCVSTTNVWAASTGKFQGDVIVPTSNNALNRGFVCSATGSTTSGAQPNWDAVADNGTLVDGTVTWTCWGTTGSGSPQFDLPLESTDGPDLVDTSPTLQIGNGARYRRKAGVQTANRTVTLGVTGVEDGDLITIECGAHATYTLAIVNGGTGGGTMYTVPAARGEVVTFKYTSAGTTWSFAGKVRAS